MNTGKDADTTRSWTGGAHWHRMYRMPRSKNEVWGIRHAGWPNVELRMDDEGGALLQAKRAIRGGIRVVRGGGDGEGKGIRPPLLWRGHARHLRERIAGVPRRFIFYSWSRGRTMEILRLGESKGVRVDRRAKNKLIVP